MGHGAAEHVAGEALVVSRSVIEMLKISVAVARSIRLRITLQPVAQSIAVIPVARVHRNRSGRVGVRVEKSPEAIAFFERISFFEIGEAKATRIARHVPDRSIAL